MLGTELHFPDNKVADFPDGWLFIDNVIPPRACTQFIHPLLGSAALEQTPVFEALLGVREMAEKKQTKSLPSGGFHSNGEDWTARLIRKWLPHTRR